MDSESTDSSPGPESEPGAPADRGGAPPPAPTTSFAAVPAHWSGGSRPAVPAPDRPADAPEAAPEPAAEQPRMAPPPDGPPSGPVPVAPWARAADATDPEGTPAVSGDHTGSSRTVAAAVAQAFAVRAAAGREGLDQPPTGRGPVPPPEPPREPRQTPTPPAPAQPAPQPVAAQPAAAQTPLPAPHGDVRDRLLAVLLHDPAVAVDATIQLDACRAQLERLSTAVRHERAVLRDILQRLARTGLRTDQMARLAGMSVDEVQALLAPVSSR